MVIWKTSVLWPRAHKMLHFNTNFRTCYISHPQIVYLKIAIHPKFGKLYLKTVPIVKQRSWPEEQMHAIKLLSNEDLEMLNTNPYYYKNMLRIRTTLQHI